MRDSSSDEYGSAVLRQRDHDAVSPGSWILRNDQP